MIRGAYMRDPRYVNIAGPYHSTKDLPIQLLSTQDPHGVEKIEYADNGHGVRVFPHGGAMPIFVPFEHVYGLIEDRDE